MLWSPRSNIYCEPGCLAQRMMRNYTKLDRTRRAFCSIGRFWMAELQNKVTTILGRLK